MASNLWIKQMKLKKNSKEVFEDYNKVRRSERDTKPVERLTYCQMAKKALKSNLCSKKRRGRMRDLCKYRKEILYKTI